MTTLLWWLIGIALFFVLGFKRATPIICSISFFMFFLLFSVLSAKSSGVIIFWWLIFIILFTCLQCRFIRKNLISRKLMVIYKKAMPEISETEKVAIESGTVSWERELFSGHPRWQNLMALPFPKLTREEQAFLDGPVEKLCGLLDDWRITHQDKGLSKEIWDFLKNHGFFSFIIPKNYGGKAFSAFAHSQILVKIYGRSITTASIVAVPNSLGPGELLLCYGTEEQKNHYLPRLAKGDEIPCFALTSPVAGSDAGSIPDHGIVCMGTFEGQEVLGMRLSWSKRYITLAPVATILGLAFKLLDPDHLLGDREELGITCALIPTTTPGVKIGNRHFPLDNPFYNGPTQGHEVFVPLDYIIGGKKMIGQGWRMLVECLSVGRGITLPASAAGGAKMATYASCVYARLREQFSYPIGFFEGIQEKITNMLGETYMLEAMRHLTLALIERGEKPAIPSAIIKYHATEAARRVINDAMDVHGGKGICMGPKNYLAATYEGTPIGITVEGANILTRNMIIFGQGAMRCHPFALEIIKDLATTDQNIALDQFDKHLFGYIHHVISNICRSVVLAWSNGRGSEAPKAYGKRYFQQLSRYSAAFSVVADAAMIVLGSNLKRKEKLSARLGDVFSYLYIASSVLRYHHEEGQPELDRDLVDWSCQHLLALIRSGLNDIIKNFPNRFIALKLRFYVFPLGFLSNSGPSDRLECSIAQRCLTPNDTLKRLAAGVYFGDVPNNALAQLRRCFDLVTEHKELEKKLEIALREKRIKGLDFKSRVTDARDLKILTEREAELLFELDEVRMNILHVDDFSEEELMAKI